MIVSTAVLPGLLEECFAANLVPFVTGPPAIGKSAIINKVAEDHKLEVIDIRLSQSDPTDLNGFPIINDDKTKAGFVPMSTFPVKGDTPPPGKDGWLIFLDEMNSAPLGTQAAAFKLTLDRKVGQYDLHENVFIACAGNRQGDKGITNRISTPMQSRLAHFELEVDNKAWLKWAAQDIDFRIRSFIGFKPDLLYRFEPTHDGATYPSPRTWEFMSRLLKKYPGAIPSAKMPLLASVVEEAAAMEFWTYSKVFQSLLTEAQIMADPAGVKVPEEPSIQFALAGSLGQKITMKNASPLMTFIKRMPIEMQVLCMQGACRRDGALMAQKDIDNWFDSYSKDLF